MRVNALASGSSGNAYLVRSGETAILVEAGLPASKLARFLWGLSVDPRSLAGILVTHAHSDHAQGAAELSRRFAVPVYASPGTLGHRALRSVPLARPFEVESRFTLGEIEVVPFRVPHDCVEPVGFRIEGELATACVVTDLGFVPDEVQPFLLGADLLVLEANHDEELLWRGPYPPFLKRRVAGPRGHLSNAAAGRCLASLEPRPPREVWLAHLSLVNNRVKTAVDLARRALSEVGLGHVAVAAAGRNTPSLCWSAEPSSVQLALF